QRAFRIDSFGEKRAFQGDNTQPGRREDFAERAERRQQMRMPQACDRVVSRAVLSNRRWHIDSGPLALMNEQSEQAVPARPMRQINPIDLAIEGTCQPCGVIARKSE